MVELCKFKPGSKSLNVKKSFFLTFRVKKIIRGTVFHVAYRRVK